MKGKSILSSASFFPPHQLLRNYGDVLDNGQARSPVVVFCQLVNGRQQRLRQVL